MPHGPSHRASPRLYFVGALEVQNQAIGSLRKGCSSLGGTISVNLGVNLGKVV